MICVKSRTKHDLRNKLKSLILHIFNLSKNPPKKLNLSEILKKDQTFQSRDKIPKSESTDAGNQWDGL